MSKLEYDGQRWEVVIHNEEEFFRVSMSNDTFLKYFAAYLESLGIPTQSYLEMMEYVHTVQKQQYAARQEFTADVERWRDCGDPDVRIWRQKYRRKA